MYELITGLLLWMRCSPYRYLYGGPRWPSAPSQSYQQRLGSVGASHPGCDPTGMNKADGLRALPLPDLNADNFGNEFDAVIMLRYILGVRGGDADQAVETALRR